MTEVFDLGRHASFIWASYGVAATVLLAMTGYLMVQRQRLKTQLAKLEAEKQRTRRPS
ncbi:MAG: heme exporter protein CcmD [Pseudomonadota bacterium]